MDETLHKLWRTRHLSLHNFYWMIDLISCRKHLFYFKKLKKNGVSPPLSTNVRSLKNYVRSRIQIDSILLFSCSQLHSTFTHIDHIHSKPCTFVTHPQFQRIFFQDFDLLKIGKLWSKFSGWRSRDGEILTWAAKLVQSLNFQKTQTDLNLLHSFLRYERSKKSIILLNLAFQ